MNLEKLSFEELLELNCFSQEFSVRAAELLEKYYCCEIKVQEMARSVRFAHHARGCTVIAAKLCENVVIFQNVTIGANMKYNKTAELWENVGNPILSENVVVCDGAKIFGPVVIGKNSVVSSGAIITKNIPPNSIAYGTNQYREKDTNYAYAFHPKMIAPEEILKKNEQLIEEFEKKNSK